MSKDRYELGRVRWHDKLPLLLVQLLVVILMVTDNYFLVNVNL